MCVMTHCRWTSAAQTTTQRCKQRSHDIEADGLPCRPPRRCLRLRSGIHEAGPRCVDVAETAYESGVYAASADVIGIPAPVTADKTKLLSAYATLEATQAQVQANLHGAGGCRSARPMCRWRRHGQSGQRRRKRGQRRWRRQRRNMGGSRGMGVAECNERSPR